MALRDHIGEDGQVMTFGEAYAAGFVPSVTEVLGLNDMTGYKDAPSSVLATASARGTEVHAWTEMIDAGRLDHAGAPDHIFPYLYAYQRFRAECGYEPLDYEIPVSNNAYGYDGTIDRIARIDGHFSILDLKCVATLMPSTALQLAGYALCFDDARPRLSGTKRTGRYALQLKPDGRYNLQPYKSREDKHDFLSAVRVAHWNLRHGYIN